MEKHILLERLKIRKPPTEFHDVCLKTFCAVRATLTLEDFNVEGLTRRQFCCAKGFSLPELAFVPPFSGIYLSICPSIYLSIYLSIHPSTHLSTHLSICLFVDLFYLHTYIYVYYTHICYVTWYEVSISNIATFAHEGEKGHGYIIRISHSQKKTYLRNASRSVFLLADPHWSQRKRHEVRVMVMTINGSFSCHKVQKRSMSIVSVTSWILLFPACGLLRMDRNLWAPGRISSGVSCTDAFSPTFDFIRARRLCRNGSRTKMWVTTTWYPCDLQGWLWSFAPIQFLHCCDTGNTS